MTFFWVLVNIDTSQVSLENPCIYNIIVAANVSPTIPIIAPVKVATVRSPALVKTGAEEGEPDGDEGALCSEAGAPVSAEADDSEGGVDAGN